MKILVVGGGGREHALVWKIKQSKMVGKIYCAPGNGGISKYAECIDVSATDIDGMVDFAKNNNIDLTIVAPDDPLFMGMVDAFEKEGLKAFGPNKHAAIIEGSKVYAKNLMKKYNIPTADYQVFQDSKKALEYLKDTKYPIVVKADGLALGKGVIIANNYKEASEAINQIMEKKKFGEAGNRVVIEEFLAGPEVSILAFTDGKTIVPMVSAQDHKKTYDNDKGLNTGGMGAFSPSKKYTKEIEEYCINNIYKPTIDAMNNEDRKFKGVLYFGLILTEDGPKVLEYNARFGDPEAQAILPRLKNDLIEIVLAILDDKLEDVNIEWDDKVAVCVTLASGGYPVKYEKGYEVRGLDIAEKLDNCLIFHAGTKIKNNNYITSGGRVLSVTGLGKTIDEARKTVYKAVEQIYFKDMHYRKDIGIK